jgi:glycosyltransferase involved in cell wall biosynthesis
MRNWDRRPPVPDRPWSEARVVLVHDWLTGMRGGEHVLAAIARLFPGADVLTLVHARGSVSPAIERHHIRTSFIQHLPRPARLYRQYLPLFPAAVECFDLDEVDLVISTSHCAAKAVVPTGRARHVCYCHSPMRYAWDQFDAYFGRDRLGPVAHALARGTMAWLARWDRATAPRVDRFIANSHFVAARIGRYYNRAASVIHPPVDVEFFTPGDAEPEPYFLVVSALVPYKRLELAIAAARRLGARLRLVGTGPDEARLRLLAGDAPIEFLGSVAPDTLRDLYQRAQALVLPAEEDFGIAPVESMACGRPVVALGRGGAAETVIHEVTGWLVEAPTAEAFAAGMSAVSTRRFDAAALAAHARQFSADAFETRFRAALTETWTAAAPC